MPPPRDAREETPEPPADCALCPRLVAYRGRNREAHPEWHNAPVAAFGGADARLLVVGLAPGLKGANRTGRPFTGDFAGKILYASLLAQGFATGGARAAARDGLRLHGCRITNAVRCAPPGNKPTGEEIGNCRRFLRGEIGSLPRLRVILALGRVAHASTLAALGLTQRAFPFRHGAIHDLSEEAASRPLRLVDSYHCSRQNVNTGRLTEEAFRALLNGIHEFLDAASV